MAKEFGLPMEYGHHYDMIDTVHLAEQFLDICPDEAQALIDAVEQTVLYKSQGSYVQDAGGLSLYFPYADRYEVSSRINTYQTTGFSPKYINYVTEFASILTGESFGYLDEVSSYQTQQEGDEFDIVLSQEELNNIAYIYFTAWLKVEGDTFMQIYQDSNVEIDANGKILTTFDGVYATVNDVVACMYEIEKGSEYTRYGIPARLNGRNVMLVVIMDAQSPDGRILGAVPEAVGGMAPKQMIGVKAGDELILRYHSDEFVVIGDEEEGYDDEEYDDDEYDSVEKERWINSEPIIVEDEVLQLGYDAVTSGSFMYGFSIVDLQNNEYYTDFVEHIFD